MDRSTDSTRTVVAEVSSRGLLLNGELFARTLPLREYEGALGTPSRTIEPGRPAPAGHRNNQVHIFDDSGIYLTEHHASGLIESVNFILDPSESPFPVQRAFTGTLSVFGQPMRENMTERDLTPDLFTRYLPGQYSLRTDGCAVTVSSIGRRSPSGRRSKIRYIVRVSVSLKGDRIDEQSR